MNPRLLRILLNQFSPDKLAKIMDLKDTAIIHHLMKEWKIISYFIPPDYQDRFIDTKMIEGT